MRNLLANKTDGTNRSRSVFKSKETPVLAESDGCFSHEM